MTYNEYVCKLIKKYKIGKPIYVKELAEKLAKTYDMPFNKALAQTSVSIKRIMDKKLIKELRFYQKGIYFRTTDTVFGEVPIDGGQLVFDKYIKDNNGYETGYYILNLLGLTTQIPNRRVIATNKARTSMRYDKNLDIYICPPKTKIDAYNTQYLKILDVLEKLKYAPIDIKEPYKIIRDYIEKYKLKYDKLLSLANNYYNKNTIIELAHVAGENE